MVAAGLMLASCTVINPTFGEEESSTGTETSNSGVTLSSSSGGSSGSTVSDSLSSTTLPSSTSGDDTSSTSSADSSESTDTASFIETTGGCGTELPDGVLAHCSVDCNVMDQDCPDGEACRAWANDGGSVWNATRCSAVPEHPDQHGDPCTVDGSAVSGSDSCDVGLMCWGVDSESLEGTCISYCEGSLEEPSCDVTETCSIMLDGVLPLCLAVCDPLLGDCSDAASVCVPGPNDDFMCVPEDAAPCPAGMLDVPVEEVAGCLVGEPCCTPYCDLTDATPCEPGMECVAFFNEPTLAYENVGVCITAM